MVDHQKYPKISTNGLSRVKSVAQEIRRLHPDKLICIAADNDHQREAKGEQNVGKSKAEEAAKIVGGHVLLPRFAKGASGSDWNDLAKLVVLSH